MLRPVKCMLAKSYFLFCGCLMLSHGNLHDKLFDGGKAAIIFPCLQVKKVIEITEAK